MVFGRNLFLGTSLRTDQSTQDVIANEVKQSIFFSTPLVSARAERSVQLLNIITSYCSFSLLVQRKRTKRNDTQLLWFAALLQTSFEEFLVFVGTLRIDFLSYAALQTSMFAGRPTKPSSVQGRRGNLRGALCEAHFFG